MHELHPFHSLPLTNTQSIGTFNEHDGSPTDRSFAINELLPHYSSHHKIPAHYQVEHLRQLCETQRPVDNIDLGWMKIFNIAANIQQQKHPQNTHLPPHPPKHQTIIHPPSSNLYQYADHQGYVQTHGLMEWQRQFMAMYEQLLKEMEAVEDDGLSIEEQIVEEERMALRLERLKDECSMERNSLKQKVTLIMQENIELQNVIKQMLLKLEMQKYHCFQPQHYPQS